MNITLNKTQLLWKKKVVKKVVNLVIIVTGLIASYCINLVRLYCIFTCPLSTISAPFYIPLSLSQSLFSSFPPSFSPSFSLRIPFSLSPSPSVQSFLAAFLSKQRIFSRRGQIGPGLNHHIPIFPAAPARGPCCGGAPSPWGGGGIHFSHKQKSG